MSGAGSFESLYRRGLEFYERGQFEQAAHHFREALRLNPHSADVLFARGASLQLLNRPLEALADFEAVLALRGDYPQAQLRRANALLVLERFQEAVLSYELHLGTAPNSAEAWHNRGTALSRLNFHGEAIACFGKALTLRPDSAQSWGNRASALTELRRFEDAIPDFERALALDPHLPYARGHLLLSRLHCCDWTGLGDERAAISSGLLAGIPAIVPFGHVMISDAPAELRQCAHAWMTRHLPLPRPLWRGERYDHARLRVAYLSGDFHTHPVSILLAGIFEHHDRARFETIGLSFGPDDAGAERTRVKAGLERFLDVRDRSDFEIALMVREMEVDILVDLMGLTSGCRSGILSHRPAPVQVNYLGYPGTMACEYVDYILADRIVIPEDERSHYSEKTIHLPGTYLPADNRRAIDPPPSREAAGLPPTGFVFCSFNNSFKLMPEMFALWMRLLKAVDGSVLWLPQGRESARRNLRRETDTQGVDAARILFAPFVADGAGHLARLSLADLFLDTLPCNAHATASDALWAGIPVLTCVGKSFAGRVAASLLQAVGLSELVTQSLEDYESLALTLARDTAMMRQIKDKLARNRTTSPAFDTALYTRNLEAAFLAMADRAA